MRPSLLIGFTLTLAGCAAGAKGQLTGPGAGTGGSSAGTGSGGAAGSHCTTAACVPPASDLTWAIEIDPPTSSTAALTELTGVDLGTLAGPDAMPLAADSQSTVAVTFIAPANASAPSAANVLLSLPPVIPGRPNLTFQAPAVVAAATTNMASASVVVPMAKLGSAATMGLFPLPPADEQSPPYSFPVTLAATLAETIPGGNISIDGRLLSPIGAAPTSTFVARAFQGGTQVSNAPITDAKTGSFQLLVPSAIATSANTTVTVQLSPQAQPASDPWFSTNPVTLPVPPASTDEVLAPIMLPAYSNLNQFNVTVVSAENGMTLSGVFVHAQTVIGTNTAGSADYARDGTTNAQGTVPLPLLPGSATSSLTYALTVVPPAGSQFATQCSTVAVTVGGSAVNTASAPTLATVRLQTRAALIGAVTESDNYPVANVAITATPGTAPTGTCTSTPAAAGSATTDATGRYVLELDPGTYQLDYDPPAGSSAPRHTEPYVVVSGNGSLEHDLMLLPGALVAGYVVGPDMSPLASATVRFYEPRCSGQDDCFGATRTAPWLRGQAVTDATGHFQVVVETPE